MDEYQELTVGELARKAGVTPRTVRFYVAEGLLPPGAMAGKHRTYGYEHYVRLRLIKLFKERYLPLRRIKAEVDRLSLAEMRELADLGNQLKKQGEAADPAGAGETLASLLTADIESRLTGFGLALIT
ncbi:MAG: MerR family transcriptional regulator, partial [Armatimonadota bacterium]